MSFLTGLLLIDAPASALNNLGSIPGARTDNTVGVKMIRTKEGAFPYVSAQAFRYWLRMTLENCSQEWKAAPIYREEKVAYADANPIRYWDDDLFGYMRAPSKKSSAKEKRDADGSRDGETPTVDTVTRVSPFRVSTLVSLAPVSIVEDFGVMSRHEGDPVPHEHQFYRTTLKGLFSLDIHAAGNFTYRNKSGYRNLDNVRIEEAIKAGLEHVESEKSYRLPLSERVNRISTLFEGMSQLQGGAKQALHYTDVSPTIVFLAATKGGNNIFGHLMGTNSRGLPALKIDALEEIIRVYKEEILTPVYVGWTRGYLDEERSKFEQYLNNNAEIPIIIQHPREAFISLVQELKKPENAVWLE